jgi:hypothetical protein
MQDLTLYYLFLKCNLMHYYFDKILSFAKSVCYKYPVKILDTSEKVTWNNCYKMCKVQWSNHTKKEATWEKEDQLKVEFSEIFSNLSESRRRDSP